MADPAAVCAEAWRQGFACRPARSERWRLPPTGVALLGVPAAGLVGWTTWRGWRDRPG